MAILVRTNTDANNFLDAAGIARTEANGSIILGICQLTTDLKQYGIWDKMKAIYPMVGQAGVSSSFEVNLKDPSTFRGIFTPGVTFANTGIKSNGSSGYMDTNLIPSSHLNLNNTHISVYIRDNVASNNPAIANTNNSSGTNELSIYPRYGNNDVYIRVNAGASPITTTTDSRGLHIGSRISASEIKYYKNNSIFSLSNNSTSLTTGTMPLLAFRYQGSIVSYYTGECAFASLGDGLTDTEATNLYTAVQRFQTTLGRQV